jgi:hypothetical protein
MSKPKELYITNGCDDVEWEDSLEQLDEMFSDHVGRYAVVTSHNHGWNNAEVLGGFEIKKTRDIVDKIGPDSEWNITIKQLGKRLYDVKLGDHDGVSDYRVGITNHYQEL